MVQFCPLFSGSSGNAAYISAPGGALLIDAGCSVQSTLAALEALGAARERIAAILLTHDHNDHIKGLRVLQKRLGVPVYGSAETLEAAARAGCLEPGAQLRVLAGPMEVAGMEVTPFDTPHDVAHSLGFRISAGERTVGFATDLGEVTDAIWRGLLGCDLVMLEANYDDSLLAVSRYPYFLKQRIRSSRGHLSNADSARCITQLALRGTARFVVGHLSQENNMPAIAAQTVEQALAEEGLAGGRDYTLQVARRSQPSEMIEF